jgi:cellulose biosynthesis protein BcsQ
MNATWTEQLSQSAEAVTLLLAGPLSRTSTWYAALQADARFRVATWANDPQDLAFKIASNPDALLLDAAIFSGPQELIDFLTRCQPAAYLLLPAQASPEEMELARRVPCVKAVYRGDVSLAELNGRIYGDLEAVRRVPAPGPANLWETTVRSGVQPVQMRIIAVWNQTGGVGKTTISTNLAYESARRGLPTLLIGLGAPDDLPLILSLKKEPNLSHWRANPTPEGLKAAIQKKDALDVLAGFPDVLSEAQAISTPVDAPNSLDRLVNQAIRSEYAVIVLDAPPTALAANAIAAANTLVLVARPSLEGVMRTVEAYRTVVERLAGQHTIPHNGVYVALNRVGARLDGGEWHRSASQLLGRSFPAIVAQIPDDPRVGAAQDNRALPLMASDEFARALKPLADALLSVRDSGYTAPQKKVIHIGPLKIRI